MKKKGFVYTLKLEDEKYYVGYTTNLARRMTEHMTGIGGAKFTSKHVPKSVLQVTEGDQNLELAQTVVMMHKHGWENVRGSEFCQVEMDAMPDVLRVYPTRSKIQFQSNGSNKV